MLSCVCMCCALFFHHDVTQLLLLPVACGVGYLPQTILLFICVFPGAHVQESLLFVPKCGCEELQGVVGPAS